MNSPEPYTTSPVDERVCSGWSIRLREDVASELFRQRTSGKAVSARLFASPLLRCSPRTFALERLLAREAAVPGVSELRVEEIALTVLHSLSQDQSCEPGRQSAPRRPRHVEAIERTRELLLKSIGRRVSLGDIARNVGLSPWHLARTFRRFTGQTIHQYLSMLRVRTALDLVLNTRIDLLTIAIDLGYSHASHFGAEFRRAYGATPSAFRKGWFGPKVASALHSQPGWRTFHTEEPGQQATSNTAEVHRD